MPYVPFELPDGNDPEDIFEAMAERLAALIPGWVGRPGHLDYAVLEAVSHMAGETIATLVAGMTEAQFRHYGETLVLLPRQEASPATATVTFILSDTAGHTIPAGTQILWSDSAGDNVILSTAGEAVVAGGQSQAANITVNADEAGTDGNRVTAGAATMIDNLSYVTSVSITTAASGGVDEETNTDYLDRLADYLQHFGATAVTAGDFAALARNVAGVDRAFAIDGWMPAGDTLGNEKTVGIVAVDADGQPLSASLKTEVDTYLQGLREINFVVNMTDPTYNDLTVVFTATALTGRDPADVEAAAEAAGLAYLDPATWGTSAGEHTWDGSTVVSYLTLARAISTADGVDKLLTMTLNGGTADVAMTGRVPLPSSVADGTSVAGTVT